MFNTKYWPRSDDDWQRYDRHRLLALKDIHDARVLRGFGDFDLVAYVRLERGLGDYDMDARVQNKPRPKDSEEIEASSSLDVTKAETSSIGEHFSLL